MYIIFYFILKSVLPKISDQVDCREEMSHLSHLYISSLRAVIEVDTAKVYRSIDFADAFY